MKIKTGDISIVENAGTFLLWYDTNFFTVDTSLLSTLQSLASSRCVAFRSVNPTPAQFHN
jgi:hypothetical protein